jgi:hypothetical protein
MHGLACRPSWMSFRLRSRGSFSTIRSGDKPHPRCARFSTTCATSASRTGTRRDGRSADNHDDARRTEVGAVAAIEDEHVLDAHMDESVHVMMLTGAPPPADAKRRTEFFCAGTDIEMPQKSAPYFKYDHAPSRCTEQALPVLAFAACPRRMRSRRSASCASRSRAHCARASVRAARDCSVVPRARRRVPLGRPANQTAARIDRLGRCCRPDGAAAGSPSCAFPAVFSGSFGASLERALVHSNIAMAIFNLLPIPPLDGFEAWRLALPRVRRRRRARQGDAVSEVVDSALKRARRGSE